MQKKQFVKVNFGHANDQDDKNSESGSQTENTVMLAFSVVFGN